jgi:hypothetical protein
MRAVQQQRVCPLVPATGILELVRREGRSREGRSGGGTPEAEQAMPESKNVEVHHKADGEP